jgi:hypothetical protein
MYANTFGAHLSGTIPELVDTTPDSTFTSKSLQEHLIYSAGLVGESALGQALSAASGEPYVADKRRSLNPVYEVCILTDGELPTFGCGVTPGLTIPEGKRSC